MQYKTMTIELLRQRPTLHNQLRKKRKLLSVVNTLAAELKHSHEFWLESLTESKAPIDEGQLTSAALEMAIQELANRLRLAFPPDGQGPLTLDASMAYLRQRTLPA